MINEQHPSTNRLATEGEELYNPYHRTACRYSCFEHEWTGNEGVYFMTKKQYRLKTFTGHTHPMPETVSGMCSNGILLTGLRDFDRDISGSPGTPDHSGFPLSVINSVTEIGTRDGEGPQRRKNDQP